MEINWQGNSSFTIKGSDATIAIDPKDDNVKADIVLFTKQDSESGIKDAKILSWPGEYEVSNVSIEAIPNVPPQDKPINIFVFSIDNIRVCSLGTLSTDLTEAIFERIGDIDILILPVGTKEVLNTKQAQTIFEEIDPRVVILSCYEGAPSEFLKAVGKTDLASKDKFSVKLKTELPEATTEFVLLNIA